MVRGNTKRGKRGVGVAAHQRGGRGGGATPTHDDSGDGEGSLVALRGTLRQGAHGGDHTGKQTGR
jgi:hypothetical protein